MILQPAEELGLGARDDRGRLHTRFPKPDYALPSTMPPRPRLPGRSATLRACLANVDSVDITVKGIGGHGAYPHTTVDPVVLASAIVMAQTVVSRNSSPLDPAVITVGSFHAGAKHNIISTRPSCSSPFAAIRTRAASCCSTAFVAWLAAKRSPPGCRKI